MITPMFASGQRVMPTETDLLASYCIGVVSADLAFIRDLAVRAEGSFPGTPAEQREKLRQGFEDSIREMERDLRRIRLYLIPRLSALDSSPLLAAVKSGEEDVAGAKEDSASCLARRQCEQLYGDSWSQCMESCIAEGRKSVINERRGRCKGTKFLPQ